MKPIHSRILSISLLLVLVALMAVTLTDYGYSWDEKTRADQGDRKLEYYEAVFSGDWERAGDLGRAGDRYPGFFDLNLALIRRVSPFNDVDTGHAFAALFGLLAIVGVWKLGALIGGTPVAFTGAAFLTLFPAWYGHMFINPKDVPFATGYVWSLYCFALWIKHYPAVSWRLVTITGLVAGATMAVRVGGLVLYCYMGLFALLGLGALYLYRKPDPRAFLKSIATPLVLRCAASLAISLAVLFLYWPAAHSNPFSHTSESLAAVTHFEWDLPVLFQGSYMPAPELPATYLHRILILTSPFAILLAWLAAAVFGASWLGAKWKGYREGGSTEITRDNILVVLLTFAVLFPLYYIVLRESTIYNGIRHLLFVLPPSAVLAGYGTVRLYRYVENRRGKVGYAVPAVFALLYLPVVSAMVQLHPYQYIYYNPLAGGFPRAVERYETEYWVTAYREAADKFLAYLDSLPDEETRGERFIVNMEHPTWLLSTFLPDDRPYELEVVRSQGEPADFYVAAISWEAHRYYYGEVVATVDRMGVPLAYIKDRRHLSPEERTMHFEPDGE